MLPLLANKDEYIMREQTLIHFKTTTAALISRKTLVLRYKAFGSLLIRQWKYAQYEQAA